MALNQGVSYIELRAKMDQLERDLKTAETKATAASKKVESRFSKAASNMGSAFKKAGPIIGTALAAGAAVGIKEIIEVEKVTAQTEARLKSTGGQANVTADEIAGLAGELQNLSAVDAEEIQSAQNLLLTFTQVRNEVGKNNDIFNQATETALDMSVALGQDLQGSVMQLGKALNDPIRGTAALRRVGVSFTEQQQEQIKTLVESGKTLDAQRLILKELRIEFGGSAKAAGDTFGGQISKLKLAVEDAAGAFLLNFRPAIESTVEGLTSYADLAMEAAMASERVNDSFQSSKDLLTELAAGVQDGRVEYERFKTTAEALAESHASFGDKFAGALLPGMKMTSHELENFYEGLDEKIKDGTPIIRESADAMEEVDEASGKAAGGVKEAATSFSNLFETKDDFDVWRESAVGSLEDLGGAFDDLSEDAHVTADEIIEAFAKQTEAAADFKENLNTLITRGAKPNLIQDLIDMGDQGAVWAEALAESNRETTKAFFNARRENEKQLNALTGVLRENASETEKWKNRSVAAVNPVISRLEKLQRLLNVGLAAPGTIRAEFPHGSPTAGGIAGSPTAWATAAMAMTAGPQMISSGYRPGDTDSYHSVPPPFNAVDVAGSNLPGVFGALMSITGNKQRELIYGNTIVQRGQVGYYAPNDHWDHVHLADMGAIVKGPAMIAQGNITEAHIPLSGPGAKGLSISGTLHIPGLGPAILEGARLEMRQQGHRATRYARTRANK